jgi:hypothetical protein
VNPKLVTPRSQPSATYCDRSERCPADETQKALPFQQVAPLLFDPMRLLVHRCNPIGAQPLADDLRKRHLLLRCGAEDGSQVRGEHGACRFSFLVRRGGGREVGGGGAVHGKAEKDLVRGDVLAGVGPEPGAAESCDEVDEIGMVRRALRRAAHVTRRPCS